MVMSDALKAWAVENLSVSADASDDEYKSAILAAIEDGTLTSGKYSELMAEDPDVKEELGNIVGQAMTQATAPMTEAIGKMAEAVGSLAEKIQAEPPGKPPEKVVGDEINDEADEIDAKIERYVKETLAKKNGAGDGSRADFAAAFMAKAAMGRSNPRLKAPVEQYSMGQKTAVYPELTASGGKHILAGQKARWVDRQLLRVPSEADLAVCGAFAKWQLFHGMFGAGAAESMLTEHDRNLILYALHEMEWTGLAGMPVGRQEDDRDPISQFAIKDRKLTPPERKAILDDTTSGGSYAVPRIFEEAIAAAPILFGELAPLVNMVNLTRGAVVDATTWTDVSFGAQTEGTAFSLATTSGLIGNLDTSIFATVAGIELGLDWESDTPINFGTWIVQRLGMKLREWMDEQIAIGDGTTEPTGIFTASGVGTASAGNGTSGPFVLGDFEKLMWGLTKAMRASNDRSCVFVTSDYMYRQARSIVVGSADQRRLLGLEHEEYKLMLRPCKIQDSIPNGSIAYVNLSYYRMYRRLGIQIRNVVEGQTLALKNTRLIIVRARYGGQPTLGASIAKMTDGPTSYGN